jgi:hypothetical protein
MQDIDRLLLPDYLPSNQDILQTRLRSTGLQEVSFDLGNLQYRMFHISGQRSERKKWIHVFENVSVVLFFAPLDRYDLALVEDRNGVGVFNEITCTYANMIRTKCTRHSCCLSPLPTQFISKNLE